MATALDSLARFNAPEPKWTIDALFVLVVALHGPMDIALAALTWSLEGNTLVDQIGLVPWIFIKAAALAGAVFIWRDYRKENPTTYPVLAAAFLGTLAGLAVALILPNAFIAVEVLA